MESLSETHDTSARCRASLPGTSEPKATGWELVLVWAALLVGGWWAVSLVISLF